MKPTDYPFEVHRLSEEDGGGYLITFPDLPGCMSDGDSWEEALHNGLDAAQSWLETARLFQDPIPKPSTYDTLFAPLPRILHQKLATKAQREGVALNDLLIALLSNELGHEPQL